MAPISTAAARKWAIGGPQRISKAEIIGIGDNVDDDEDDDEDEEEDDDDDDDDQEEEDVDEDAVADATAPARIGCITSSFARDSSHQPAGEAAAAAAAAAASQSAARDEDVIELLRKETRAGEYEKAAADQNCIPQESSEPKRLGRPRAEDGANPFVLATRGGQEAQRPPPPPPPPTQHQQQKLQGSFREAPQQERVSDTVLVPPYYEGRPRAGSRVVLASNEGSWKALAPRKRTMAGGVSGRLQLKICSARHLGSSERSIYPFVQVVSGLYKEKTSHRKCALGQKTVYWNQKFVVDDVNAGGSVRLEVKNKESFLSPPTLMGVVILQIPESANQLEDVWIPILKPRTMEPTTAELHCVFQFEANAPSSVARRLTVAGGSASHSSLAIGADASQRHASVAGGGSAGGAPTTTTTPAAAVAAAAASRRAAEPYAAGSEPAGPRRSPPRSPVNNAKTGKQTRPLSGFDGHAAALTINELMDSLEKVKHIIESHSGAGTSGMGMGVVVQDSDPERLNLLRSARDELDSVQAQIENEATISDEWRAKLVDLASAYGADLAVLLSAEAWDDVNRRRSRIDLKSASSGGAPGPHESSVDGKPVFQETTKTFTLDSLELFDALLDQGYAVEVVEPGNTDGPLIAPGDKVSLDYVVYIWDSVNMLAVSYADSSSHGTLDFCVGDEEQPVGLSLGLAALHQGARFNICISPPLAYGENGTTDVPPSTHVLYEGTVRNVERNAGGAASPGRDAEDADAASDGVPSIPDPNTLLKTNRMSIRYPARQNRFSLAQPAEEIPSPSPSPPPPPSSPPSPPPAAHRNAKPRSPAQHESSSTRDNPPPLPPRSDYVLSKKLGSSSGPAANLKAVPPRPSTRTILSSSTSAPSPPSPPCSSTPIAQTPSVSTEPPPKPSNSTSSSIAASPSSSGEAPPTNGSLNRSVDEWLADVGFEQFAPAFHDLGVEELADFGLLQKADLERIGMRLIQVRKFIAHVANLGISIA